MPTLTEELRATIDLLKAEYRREAEWRRLLGAQRDVALGFLATEVGPALDAAIALLAAEHIDSPCGDDDCADVALHARLVKLRSDGRFFPTVTIPPPPSDPPAWWNIDTRL